MTWKFNSGSRWFALQGVCCLRVMMLRFAVMFVFFTDDVVMSRFCCFVSSSASLDSHGVGRDKKNCGGVWQTRRCGGRSPSETAEEGGDKSKLGELEYVRTSHACYAPLQT